MLTVDEYGDVQRRFHVQKQPIKQIVRETGISRNTIRKYLRDPAAPEYRRREPPTRPVLGAVAGVIDEILKADKPAPRKQRHTARRIYERLRDEHGFQGGETTVREYVAAKKREMGLGARAVTFPLARRPEEACAEADWGSRKAVIEGEEIDAHLFAVRFAFSGRLFVQAFPLERQEMFFEAHRRAFEFFGGVPPLVRYDNLKTAVRKILKGRGRLEQQAFSAFRAHYLYEAGFCNPAAPNEKGGVEGAIGYVGRNFFTPVPEFESFEALNAALRRWCEANDGRVPQHRSETVGDLFRQEAPHLVALPGRPFECCRVRAVRASHEALVSFDCNRYSVPVAHAHRKLTLKAFPFEVRIADGETTVASHPRSFERGACVPDPLHYLPLLERKPGALLHARPFQGWKLPPIFAAFHAELLRRDPLEGGREYVRILTLLRTHPVERVAAALEMAAAHRCHSRDAVLCLLNQDAGPQTRGPMDLSRFPRLAPIRVTAPDLARYDALLGKETLGHGRESLA